MTPGERFTLIMFGIGVLVTLAGWGVRMLWHVASSIQAAQDATESNSKATEELTAAVSELTGRMAHMEGRMETRRRWWQA